MLAFHRQALADIVIRQEIVRAPRQPGRYFTPKALHDGAIEILVCHLLDCH
jgi:hypothetical protein